MPLRKKILAPSLLAADFSKLREDIAVIEDAGAGMLHIDVMDGNFVPNISIGPPVIAMLRPISKLIFDVHLMVHDPDRYLEAIAEAGADIITVHAEACPHLHRTIFKIRQLGKKACVALSPATPLNALDYIIDDLYMVLVMTVEPGFGGQLYIPAMTSKIRNLSKIIAQSGNDVLIEVDGGITQQTIHEVLQAGADVIVSGSAVFGGDAAKKARELNKILGAYSKKAM